MPFWPTRRPHGPREAEHRQQRLFYRGFCGFILVLRLPIIINLRRRRNQQLMDWQGGNVRGPRSRA